MQTNTRKTVLAFSSLTFLYAASCTVESEQNSTLKVDPQSGAEDVSGPLQIPEKCFLRETNQSETAKITSTLASFENTCVGAEIQGHIAGRESLGYLNQISAVYSVSSEGDRSVSFYFGADARVSQRLANGVVLTWTYPQPNETETGLDIGRLDKRLTTVEGNPITPNAAESSAVNDFSELYITNYLWFFNYARDIQVISGSSMSIPPTNTI